MSETDRTNEELLAALVFATEAACADENDPDAEHLERRLIVAVLARMSPSWQPIETAPRDETDVLLVEALNGRNRPPIVAGWFEKFTDCPGWYSQNDPDNIIDIIPTHWMHLPASPSHKGDKRP